MAYGVYSDRGYREHILERNKNTNKTEVFTQEDQTFTGRKTFLSGVTTSDLEVRTVEVSESLKVKGKDITEIIDYLPNDVSKENKLTTKDFVNSSISTNTANFLGTLNTVKASVEDIQALIPNQATKDNQLADKDFVNSSISTNTANFLGTFNTLEEIEALTDVTNNDYAFWKTTDTLGNVVFKRYKYIADEQLWKFEYDLNNSSFTAKQWEAINSGITAELVAKIGHESALPIYSTEETVIGKWIDGKPIYRKVFPINFYYNDGMRNVAKDIYNVSHVIHCFGVDYNNTNGSIYFRGWTRNGYLQAMGEYHSGNCTHVIFEYTKTTD